MVNTYLHTDQRLETNMSPFTQRSYYFLWSQPMTNWLIDAKRVLFIQKIQVTYVIFYAIPLGNIAKLTI